MVFYDEIRKWDGINWLTIINKPTRTHMSFTSYNSADNISVKDAQAFVDKMRALGLPFGPLHADENEGGGVDVTSVIAISELEDGELDENGKYFLKSFCGRDFHGIAGLKRRLESAIEPMAGFDAICDEIGVDTDAALLKIPGVTKFIVKALQA